MPPPCPEFRCVEWGNTRGGIIRSPARERERDTQRARNREGGASWCCATITVLTLTWESGRGDITTPLLDLAGGIWRRY